MIFKEQKFANKESNLLSEAMRVIISPPENKVILNGVFNTLFSQLH